MTGGVESTLSTISVPPTVGPVPDPWQSLPLVARTTNAYVPGGVVGVVCIVKVLRKSILPGFCVEGLALNEATMLGCNPEITSRVTVHAVLFPFMSTDAR